MKKRRGRGEGTIYQRDSGDWVAMCSMGVDGNGKRIRRTVAGKTKAIVQQKLRELQDDADSGVSMVPANLKLTQYLRPWLEDVSRPRTAEGAHRENTRYVELHILPMLGGLPLTKITPQHVRMRRMLRELEQNEIGPTTRAKVLNCLKRALRDAVRDGTLRISPANAVDSPRIPTPERRSFTQEQVRTLIQISKNESPKVHALVALLCGTGARIGETLGLRWKDVDLRERRLHIRRNLAEYTGPELKEPKTKSSSREIEMPDVLVRALERLRRSLPAVPHGSMPVLA